jgi:hypothetical protein
MAVLQDDIVDMFKYEYQSLVVIDVVLPRLYNYEISVCKFNFLTLNLSWSLLGI